MAPLRALRRTHFTAGDIPDIANTFFRAGVIEARFAPSFTSMAKRIPRKQGYPLDKQRAATNTVLQQAELLSDLRRQPRDPSRP
jgi:hypothetical protein